MPDTTTEAGSKARVNGGIIGDIILIELFYGYHILMDI